MVKKYLEIMYYNDNDIKSSIMEVKITANVNLILFSTATAFRFFEMDSSEELVPFKNQKRHYMDGIIYNGKRRNFSQIEKGTTKLTEFKRALLCKCIDEKEEVIVCKNGVIISYISDDDLTVEEYLNSGYQKKKII